MRKSLFLASFFLTFSLHAKKESHEELVPLPPSKLESPWFTGPLLAPSGTVIPGNHYNIEPYIYVIANTAKYDHNWKPIKIETFWNIYFQTSFQFGLTQWLDVQFNPSAFHNSTQGKSSWELADMPIDIDIQLYTHGKHVRDWITALKLVLREVVPLGPYQKLNPKKLGTDAGGEGSWQTGLGLVWGNTVYLGGLHFLSIRSSVLYTLPAPVHVKKFNVYGGGPGTRGTVYPAQNFIIDIGSELTLTKNWVFAMDMVGAWGGKTRFKGRTFFPNTEPPFAQFSLAPAIEYNWNNNLGIILGPWFTIAGRNALQFASVVFAFNYYK